MFNARVISGTAAVVLGSGLAVYAAQNAQRITLVAPQPFAAFHQSCVTSQGHDDGAAAKSHVPAHFSQALDLTAAQLADIERMSAELCQTVTKTHEAMMNVLTPEQRAKMVELHGSGDSSGHHAGGLHALMKKLHGR